MQALTNINNTNISECRKKRTISIKDKRMLRLKRTKLTQTPAEGKYSIKLVKSPEGLREACKLVHDRYFDIGLINKQNSGLWVTPYQINPDSRAVIALMRISNKPIATATLVQDSPNLGLPSDKIYPEEINRLRAKNRKIVEITSLAAKPCKEAVNAFLHVFKWLGVYAIVKGYDDMVISVHPKHAPFYEDILLFERIGGLKYYPGLKEAPAYLEWTDLQTLPERMKQAYSDLPDFANLYKFFAGNDMEFIKKMRDMIEKEDMCPPKDSWDHVMHVNVAMEPDMV